jgi:hypothetical protein
MSSTLRTRVLLLLLAAVASGGSTVVAQDAPAPDICLTIGAALEGEGSAVIDAVRTAIAERPVLIPDPLVGSMSATDQPDVDPWLRVGVWSAAEESFLPAPSSSDITAWCGDDPIDGAWSAAFSGEFLRAGTRRELAAAPTTPGFSSSIDVEWDESADLVRTVLTFSGPLDIPNGTCWMDDVVSADGEGDTVALTTTGSQTSPFGDGVCGRFEEFLPDGGAGAQAIVLLPREIALSDGSVLDLRVERVDVRDDAIHLTGSVAREGAS